MSATFLASAGRVIWRMAEGFGLDPAALFEQAGLDPETLEQPRSRYSFAKVCAAWERLAELSGKPDLGLEAGKYYRVTDLHAVGVTFLASSNLLEALARIDRYETVLNSKIDFEIVHHPDRVDFVCQEIDIPSSATRIIEDMRNAMLIDLARRGLNESFKPLELGVTYAQPEDLEAYARIFDCPIKFNQPHSYISFSITDVQTPFTARNIDLAHESDRILDSLLKGLQEQDFVSRTSHIIAEALPSGTPSEALVALALLTSPRTLNRRLAEQNTSFRQLLKDVRLELAERYLRDTEYPVTEISYLLGFSDVSAFSRAFKRWTNTTPVAYRRQSQ